MKDLALKIHILQDGRYQTSHINPITKNRVRHKFNSKKDAESLLKEVEHKFLTKNYSYFLEMYVMQVVEQHLRDNPETKLNERANVFRSFCNEFQNFKMNELNRQALKNWFDKIQKENNYSDRTLNTIKSQINWLFKPLIADGLLEESPLDKIKFKRFVSPKRPRVFLSVEEVQCLLENARTFSPHGLFPFLSTVTHTGARRSEILRLESKDIDFATKLIHIKKSKNGRERFIKMSPTLESVLKTHLESHKGSSLFVNEHGTKLNSDHELDLRPKLGPTRS